MRSINFLMIFAICLALVLFSLQNTEPTVIQVFQGIQVQAPLCVELLLSMGVGAILAWFFSVWTRLLRGLESRNQVRQIRLKDERIQELEQNIEQFKAEIQQQHQLPPGTESLAQENAVTEVFAQ